MTDGRRQYEALVEDVTARYLQSRYRDALALVESAPSQLLPWRADLAHLAACLHAADGDAAAGLAALRSASAAGEWWDERILLTDDDLADVRALPGFAELVEESRRWTEAHDAEPAVPPVVLRPEGAARAVLVVLHGADQTADFTARTWAAATGVGCVVVAVTSSRRSTPRYRTWPDQGVAAADVRIALDALPAGDRALPVVAAGFSAGGRAALLWALAGDPRPVTAVVAFAPAVEVAQLPAGTGVQGRLLVGADDDLADGVRAVAAATGITLRVVPGLGHVYPDDFPDLLTAALDEVLSRG